MGKKDVEYDALKVILEDESRAVPLSELSSRLGVPEPKIVEALVMQVQKGALLTQEEDDPLYGINPDYAGLDDLRLAVAKNVDISLEADGSATFTVRDASSGEDED